MTIRDRLPALFAAASIITALLFSYHATRAVNYTVTGSGFELPVAAGLFIALCRYHVITGIGVLAVAVIYLIETTSKSERQKMNSLLMLMRAFLILLSGWFFSMSIVHLGFGGAVPDDGGPAEWLRRW